MNNQTSAVGGTPYLFILFVVFLILKLTKVIAWKWVWVTAPLWGGVLLFILILMLIFIPKLISLALLRLATIKKRKKAREEN